MKRRRLLAVLTLVAALLTPGVLSTTGAAVAVGPGPCDNREHGDPLGTTPWPQNQLDLAGLQQISEGRYTTPGRWDGHPIAVGDPVNIAIIDSGFDPSNGVFGNPRAYSSPILNAIAPKRGIADCQGHGTAVASLIFAQPGNGTTMVGFAPQAHLIPVRYLNGENGESAPFALGLKDAIDAGARVINVSSQFTNRSVEAVRVQLARAKRLGIIIVAAAGNEKAQSHGPFWPAAYSPHTSNIIAVGAVGRDGSPGSFSFKGNYIDVAAPGVAVPVANRGKGSNFLTEDGTSFAAPLVTATVALILATHPEMTPAQVKHRLETTADPPAGAVPDPAVGYGTINPLLAVTSEQDDNVSAPSPPTRGSEIAVAAPAAPPSRGLEHRALAAAFVLLGLAVLTVTGAAVLHGGRRARRA